MMNADGSGVTGSSDDQQMVSVTDRENCIARLTNHLGGNRDLAIRFDDAAYNRSGGKMIFYRRMLQTLLQQRNQQLQQQQQQQQSMINSQNQQQMYMQPQQIQMSGMPQQQQQQPSSQPSYTMQAPQPSSSVMNVKQEPQSSLSNMQPRISTQNFPMQQQQQIKQEPMVPPMQHQQSGLQVQQMRSQQQQQQSLPPPPPQYIQQQQQQAPVLPPQPATSTPPQRTLVQHLQQARQQNHLNQQQQQQESPNPSQLQQQQQQQQQPTNPSILPQSSSTSSGSQDEILQHILSSPNPPKQPSTVAQNAVQARLRTMNRNVHQPVLTTQQQQQQPSPMAPGSDPMMTVSSSNAVPSPHSHPGMMQQQPTPLGPPGQSPLARYMMAQSPQGSVGRPPMSPMNMMNYNNSPTVMIDDEIQFFLKFFTERIQYLIRIIARCQQEGQHDKIPKYRQLHDQMSAFIRNPISEHLMVARRLKEHSDRMLGPVLMPPINDMSTMVSSGPNNTRLITNGIFEQCQRTIVDYLGKDSILKYNIAKRFLEPLSEVLNGIPHKTIRLDTESKQIVEPHLSSTNNHSLILLTNIIESEFAHLSMNTYSYELKPMCDKISSSPSIMKNKDSIIHDYELTCRLIEINMPIIPPLKMKLTSQYPNEPPEILSLTSTIMNITPTKLEHSDGNTFFESISRNFIYFLFKLPTQHTITDILDIWHTAIENASFSQNELKN